MKNLTVSGGNADTHTTYNPQASAIFWSLRATNTYSNNAELQASSTQSQNDNSAFDKNLKAILTVPKP